MIVSKSVLAFFMVFATVIVGSPMYKLIHQRAELLSYDAASLAGPPDFHFGKINRTAFALNTSFTLLTDYSKDKIMVGVYVDKLFGTEFKRTGTKLSLNVCKLWERNLFRMRETISANGNLTACNVAPGYYYLRNYLPQDDQFPRYLPYGSYRVEIIVETTNNKNLFDMYWFAKVEQLPK